MCSCSSHSKSTNDFLTFELLFQIEPYGGGFFFYFLADNPIVDVDNLIVTASHAIFHVEDKKSAPVAVIGYQFQHSALFAYFRNMTMVRALE